MCFFLLHTGSQKDFDPKTMFFSMQIFCVPSAMTLLYICEFNFACILMTFSFIFPFALANSLNRNLALEVRLFSKFAQRGTEVCLSTLL